MWHILKNAGIILTWRLAVKNAKWWNLSDGIAEKVAFSASAWNIFVIKLHAFFHT